MTKKTLIYPNRISLSADYFQKCEGILNGLSTASAQYLYKVIERYTQKKDRRWFDQRKLNKLRRGIVHADPHLDEYFAELLFRSILPPHLKDLEIKEHVLVSKDNDTYAQISWPEAVVFGIGGQDTGGATPLQVFDEHASDGSREGLACSQIVVDEFLPKKLPESIKIVLDEVAMSDSRAGAHPYNLKNIITGSMHNTMFHVLRDDITGVEVNKFLTDNWKRAIVNACIVAMIYAYENNLYKKNELSEKEKIAIERETNKSLKYFTENTTLRNHKLFNSVKGKVFSECKIGGKRRVLDKAIWRDSSGKEICKQILILHRICYALQKCWGWKIANFVMMHIWQCHFQEQMMFREIYETVKGIQEGVLLRTSFGSMKLDLVESPGFFPVQPKNENQDRKFRNNSPLWLLEVTVVDPRYYNVIKASRALINQAYGNGGNNGFGIIYAHNKSLNSKFLTACAAIPLEEVWNKVSDKIVAVEPDRWFQLKNFEGAYSPFIMNRTKAHQEHLPSTIVNIEYIKNVVLSI